MPTRARVLLALAVSALTPLLAPAQGLVTQWNFPPGFNTTAPAPSTGSGTASLVGGTTGDTAGGLTNAGSTEATAGSTGWSTLTYPAQSTNSGTAGTRYTVSSAGVSDLVFRFDLRHSNTSSRFVQVQYTLDGTTFTPAATFAANLGGDVWYNNRTVDLSGVGGANNNAAFAVRVVSVFDPANNTSYTATTNGSTYATTGTNRYDAVTLTAAHVFTGAAGGGSLGAGANYAGGTAPTATSTVLLGAAAPATVTAAPGGTTVAQFVTRPNAPAVTVGGADTLTLTAGLVHGATNALTVTAPLAFGQSNTVQNSGTVNLNGATTFTNFLNLQGGRTNANGTLTGSISTSPVTTGNPAVPQVRVTPGATLGGTGAITQGVLVAGLSPTSAGVITAGTLADPSLNIGTTATAANLVLGANAAYDAKLFGTGAADVSLLAVTGNVTIDAAARLTLDLSDVSPAALRSAAPGGRTYTVLTGTGATVNNFTTALTYSNLNGFDPSEFALVATPTTGTVQVQFTPVPEPAAVLAVGALALVAVRRLRRTAG